MPSVLLIALARLQWVSHRQGGPQSVTEVVGPRPNLDLSDKYFKLPKKSSFEDMARGFDNEKYISIQTRI